MTWILLQYKQGWTWLQICHSFRWEASWSDRCWLYNQLNMIVDKPLALVYLVVPKEPCDQNWGTFPNMTDLGPQVQLNWVHRVNYGSWGLKFLLFTCTGRWRNQQHEFAKTSHKRKFSFIYNKRYVYYARIQTHALSFSKQKQSKIHVFIRMPLQGDILVFIFLWHPFGRNKMVPRVGH